MFLRRKAITDRSDHDLVLLLRKGHQVALGQLWDRYAHLLYGVGMKYLRDPERSKDEVVELFAGLTELVKKHEVQNFRPWIHTVMRNRCLQVLRSSKPNAALPDVDLRSTVTEDTEEGLLHEATLQQLEIAIAQLVPEQRSCIELFHLQRFSYQQVTERTGFSLEQVRSHLQNGRRNLKIIMQRARSVAQRHG